MIEEEQILCEERERRSGQTQDRTQDSGQSTEG